MNPPKAIFVEDFSPLEANKEPANIKIVPRNRNKIPKVIKFLTILKVLGRYLLEESDQTGLIDRSILL